MKVHPCERVRFIVTEAKAKDKTDRVQAEGIGPLMAYDSAEYIKLLTDAANEVLA
jgi:hypothetical protein